MRQIGLGSKRPLVRIDSVETLVVEHSQQTGIGRRAIGLVDGQSPLFLLPWCQTVTERLPLHLQLFLWHGATNHLLVLIALAILDPCEGDQ